MMTPLLYVTFFNTKAFSGLLVLDTNFNVHFVEEKLFKVVKAVGLIKSEFCVRPVKVESQVDVYHQYLWSECDPLSSGYSNKTTFSQSDSP